MDHQSSVLEDWTKWTKGMDGAKCQEAAAAGWAHFLDWHDYSRGGETVLDG
jgi:hypothetical protein